GRDRKTRDREWVVAEEAAGQARGGLVAALGHLVDRPRRKDAPGIGEARAASHVRSDVLPRACDLVVQLYGGQARKQTVRAGMATDLPAERGQFRELLPV